MKGNYREMYILCMFIMSESLVHEKRNTKQNRFSKKEFSVPESFPVPYLVQMVIVMHLYIGLPTANKPKR